MPLTVAKLKFKPPRRLAVGCAACGGATTRIPRSVARSGGGRHFGAYSNECGFVDPMACLMDHDLTALGAEEAWSCEACRRQHLRGERIFECDTCARRPTFCKP